MDAVAVRAAAAQSSSQRSQRCCSALAQCDRHETSWNEVEVEEQFTQRFQAIARAAAPPSRALRAPYALS